MNERIKKLRRTLDLTQQEFAARIGSVQNTITGYETGRRVPSSQVVSLICKEFGVNEDWLRNGEGPMFVPAPSSALDALAAERHLSHGDYVFLEKLLEMKPEKRQAVMDFMLEFAKDILGGDVPMDAPAYGGGVADAEALYERRFGFASGAESTASNTTADTDPAGGEKIG